MWQICRLLLLLLFVVEMTTAELFLSLASGMGDLPLVARQDSALKGGSHDLFSVFVDGERRAIFKPLCGDAPPPLSYAEEFKALKPGDGPAREHAVQILSTHLRKCGILATPPASAFVSMPVQRGDSVVDQSGTIVAFLNGVEAMEDAGLCPVDHALFFPVCCHLICV